MTERGQNIRRQTNVVYVSTNMGKEWTLLQDFVNVSFFSSIIFFIFGDESTLSIQHLVELKILLHLVTNVC